MRRSALVTRTRDLGLSAEGARFYVWDMDAPSALAWASELHETSTHHTIRGGYRPPVDGGGAAPTASGDTP